MAGGSRSTKSFGYFRNTKINFQFRLFAFSFRQKARNCYADNLGRNLGHDYSPDSFGKPVWNSRGRVRDDNWGRSGDRKSTRLNSSHGYNPSAVFCFQKQSSTLPTPHDRRVKPACYAVAAQSRG